MNTNILTSLPYNTKLWYFGVESRLIFGDGGTTPDKTNIGGEVKNENDERTEVQHEIKEACTVLSNTVDNQIDNKNLAEYIIKKSPQSKFNKQNFTEKLAKNPDYKKAMIAKFGCPNPTEITSNSSGYSYTATPGNLNIIDPSTSYYYYETDKVSDTNNNTPIILENGVNSNDNESTQDQAILDSIKNTFSKKGNFQKEAETFDIKVENIKIHNGVIFVPMGDMSNGKKPKATLLIANEDTTIEGIKILKGFSLLPVRKEGSIIFLADNPNDAFNNTKLKKYKVDKEKTKNIKKSPNAEEPVTEVLDMSSSHDLKGKEKDDLFVTSQLKEKINTSADTLVSVDESLFISQIKLSSTHEAIQKLVTTINNAKSNSEKITNIQRALLILPTLAGDNTNDIAILNNALFALTPKS